MRRAVSMSARVTVIDRPRVRAQLRSSQRAVGPLTNRGRAVLRATLPKL
jgi:hypothetical protein